MSENGEKCKRIQILKIAYFVCPSLQNQKTKYNDIKERDR